ncbi:MAG: ArsR family transcriptional regulator [Alphaproteobacteria bacterium]|nr:MAG: ArsR family transcriptional regulator [Alphaproteobacteria bacterium]
MTSRIVGRLATLEAAWTDPAGTRPELVEPELTALTAEVVAVIAERGSPTWEQDLEALAHAIGRLWHRLPPGADQSEAHWHGHLSAVAEMLGIAQHRQADEAEIKQAVADPVVAKVLQALAEGDAAPTNSELAERCGLSEETVSSGLKDAQDCGLVITAKLGRFNRATLTGTGRWAVETLLSQPAPQQGWQPIETAPKCVNVLLYSPFRCATNQEEIAVGFAECNGSSHAWATHWMPLPHPPVEEEPK